ncbi:hypothetical protein KY290_021497 [Solanum tuberosum]|uniref:RNase H family protein n=1 Tax=Solanum tuberosum TaxID=4113 RepID=A0ABQ7V3A2_SOLTU|nr:hypothetical protein KY290_021497 [Solanum tuberosum]
MEAVCYMCMYYNKWVKSLTTHFQIVGTVEAEKLFQTWKGNLLQQDVLSMSIDNTSVYKDTVDTLHKYKPTLHYMLVPQEGWVTCNTNGAGKGNLRQSSYGYCIRDGRGDLIYAEAQSIGEATNMEAEVLENTMEDNREGGRHTRNDAENKCAGLAYF